MEKQKVLFTWLDKQAEADLELPKYETALSAGMDIRLAIEKDILLQPGEIKLLPTGFAVAIADGYEIQLRPRSGLAVKHGITLINSPGTIDADYRGEIKVGLINLGPVPYRLKRGDRIAQMILAPVVHAELVVTDSLDRTTRGAGGFGHTGTV